MNLCPGSHSKEHIQTYDPTVPLTGLYPTAMYKYCAHGLTNQQGKFTAALALIVSKWKLSIVRHQQDR